MTLTPRKHSPRHVPPAPALSKAIVVSLLVLLLAACGEHVVDRATPNRQANEHGFVAPNNSPAPTSSEVGALDPGDVVFTWTETGGCIRGANCAHYEITADGTVRTFRTHLGTTEPEADAQGVIPRDLAEAWIALVNDSELSGLLTRVGPGEMTSVYDGIDYVLTAPFADLTLSSITNDFDRSEPLFATAFALAHASFESAPLSAGF